VAGVGGETAQPALARGAPWQCVLHVAEHPVKRQPHLAVSVFGTPAGSETSSDPRGRSATATCAVLLATRRSSRIDPAAALAIAAAVCDVDREANAMLPLLLAVVRRAGAPVGRQRYHVTPEWLERYSNLESDAAVIGTYEAEVIPGLLQTERYVRAITLTWSSVSSSCACSISGCIVARGGIGCGPSPRTVPPPPAAAAWPAEVESADQPGRASRLSLSYRLRSAGGRFESGCVPLSLGLE
jgi:Domain of unknown function (DUF5753)